MSGGWAARERAVGQAGELPADAWPEAPLSDFRYSGNPSGPPPRERRQPATVAVWMVNLPDRQGMAREAAAGRLGVSATAAGRWIGGETEPRLHDPRRIQEEFGELPFP